MFRDFLAYKYVFRLITLAALLGVTFSVTVLIVVVSVMEGFRNELENRIRGTTSDIRVESSIFFGLEDPKRVEGILKGIRGVRSTALHVETLALYRREEPWMSDDTVERLLVAYDPGNQTAVEEIDSYLRAVKPPDVEEPFASIFREIIDGLPKDSKTLFSRDWLERGLWEHMKRFRIRPPPDDAEDPYSPAIVGIEAMRQESLIPGARFELTSFSPIPPHEPRVAKFYAVGYFKTGLYELDSRQLILRLGDADRFLKLRGNDDKLRVSAVRVGVEDGYQDEEALVALRESLERTLAGNGVLFVKVQTWREAKDALLQAVKMEKVLVSIILGVVILFAGFMIFIILSVQVVEKTRDIGVLVSLGSTARGIAGIYFRIGFGLCVAGTLLGTLYGVGFAKSINTIQRWIKLLTGYELFPQDVYYLDYIPVCFRSGDLFFIIIPTVAASLIASMVPALRAARKDPAISLRYE